MDAMTDLKALIHGYYCEGMEMEEFVSGLLRIQNYIEGDAVKQAVAGYYDGSLDMEEIAALARSASR
jgi:hypothetical protein